MKHLKHITIMLLICFCICAMSFLAHADTGITFAWDMNPTSEDLAGFYLFQRTADGTYDYNTPIATIADPAARTYTLQNVGDHQSLVWVLRAYDIWGLVSDNSNETSDVDTGKPYPPGSFRIEKIEIIMVP